MRAYKARLEARVEEARIARSGAEPEYADEQIRDLEEQVRRLRERVEFNEKMLGGGKVIPVADSPKQGS